MTTLKYMSRPPVVTSGGTVHLRCDMTYSMTRDLAKYRLNTRRLMHQARVAPHYRSGWAATALWIEQQRAGGQPEWLRRQTAKVLSAPTESELRALWGDR